MAIQMELDSVYANKDIIQRRIFTAKGISESININGEEQII
jgi:hypothetical protein